MRLIQRAATGLLAFSTLALVACQNKEASQTSDSQSSASAPQQSASNVFDTGKLRAVVIGDALPMVKKDGDNYDGLSFVVLEAIRDQLNVSPLKKDKDIDIEPVAVGSAQEGLNKIRSGEADIACGVAFSWKRQRTPTYTLPFAMGVVRVLAPKGNEGTPDSLSGQTVVVVNDSVAAVGLASSVDDASFQFLHTPAQAPPALQH